MSACSLSKIQLNFRGEKPHTQASAFIAQQKQEKVLQNESWKFVLQSRENSRLLFSTSPKNESCETANLQRKTKLLLGKSLIKYDVVTPFPTSGTPPDEFKLCGLDDSVAGTMQKVSVNTTSGKDSCTYSGAGMGKYKYILASIQVQVVFFDT